MKIHLLFVLLFVSSYVFPNTGSVINEKDKIEIGDYFKVKLELNPKVSIDLVGQKIFNSFHVVDIEDDNLFLVAVDNYKSENTRKILIDKKEYILDVSSIPDVTGEKVELPKSFLIVDQFERYKFNILLISIILLLVLLTLYYLRKNIKKKRELERKIKEENERLEKLYSYWKSFFLKASTRLDYEEIFKRRDEWFIFAKKSSSLIQDFFVELEKYQYKKDWSQEELNAVKKAFDEMRSILRQNDRI